jgi:hypothetical protein
MLDFDKQSDLKNLVVHKFHEKKSFSENLLEFFNQIRRQSQNLANQHKDDLYHCKNNQYDCNIF